MTRLSEDWTDHYATLMISPTATEEEIRKQYKFLVQRLHPDKPDACDANKDIANEATKRLNLAKEVLLDSEKRRAYDAERLKRFGNQSGGALPVPRAEPSALEFLDAQVGHVKSASIRVENDGGPHSLIRLDTVTQCAPDSWLQIIGWESLGDADLPLELRIQAVGDVPLTSYEGQIVIKLDEQETSVGVRLVTKRAVMPDRPSPAHAPNTRAVPTSSTQLRQALRSVLPQFRQHPWTLLPLVGMFGLAVFLGLDFYWGCPPVVSNRAWYVSSGVYFFFIPVGISLISTLLAWRLCTSKAYRASQTPLGHLIDTLLNGLPFFGIAFGVSNALRVWLFGGEPYYGFIFWLLAMLVYGMLGSGIACSLLAVVTRD